MNSPNHPDQVDDPLLQSARSILSTSSRPTFTVQPWRSIMSKSPAKNAAKEAQATDVKNAEKKLAKAGITRPKHVPESVRRSQLEAEEAQGTGTTEAGVDTPTSTPVQSGFSVFNPQPVQEQMMSKKDAEKATPLTEEQKAEIAKVKAEAKAKKDAAKAEKAEAAAKAKAKAEREQKAAGAAAEKEAKKAEREKAAAEKKAAREAAEAEAKAKGLSYTGSMLALRDVKNTYVKASNGRLRSTDAVAEALDAVQPAGTVELAMKLLGLEVNPYAKLNVGQQSMNLRNKLRGAVRGGKLTIEALIAARDEGGYTKAVTEARAAAEQKAKERAEKKAADDAAKAAKAAEKAAEPAPATA